MMFTCSALRCSVFDGSAISGTSDDPGADDPLAAQCIPDSVLYVTVDDHACVDVFRDLEHPTHLPFDASGDVRRRDTPVVQGQYTGGGDGERGEPRAIQSVHDKTVELSHISLHAGRGGSFRRGRASVLQTVSTCEDVSVGTRAVNDH